MSTVLEQRSLPGREANHAPWVVLGLALALLYVPLYLEAAKGLWRDDAYAHGPIVLAIAYWLLWRNRHVMPAKAGIQAAVAGWLLVAVALAAYVVGRAFEIPLFSM